MVKLAFKPRYKQGRSSSALMPSGSMLSYLDHQTWTIRASSAVLARHAAGATLLSVTVGKEEDKLPWPPQVVEAMGEDLTNFIIFPYLALLLQNCTFFIFYNNCNILLNCSASNTQTIEKLNIYTKLKFQSAVENE